ncbi:tetratricopeptide repeat protein [Catenulispora yoronensis]
MRDATDGDRQDGEWSVAWLSSELRELRRQAGHPSLSDINKLTKHGPARATISELLAGQRKWAPPWETLSNVVQALIAHARDKNLGLDPRLANLEEWRRLHGLVVRDIERSKRNANKARLELIEQFSVLPPGQMRRPPFHTLDDLVTSWEGRPRPARSGYLPRADFDEEMWAALASQTAPYPFILVYGDDGVGKSTSAWTAVTSALRPETKVLIPRDSAAVANLADSGSALVPAAGPSLIWMDSLSAAALDHLAHEKLDVLTGHAAIVATISAAECATILSSRTNRMSTARAALKRAHLIHLPRDPELAEQIWDVSGGEVVPAEVHGHPQLAWLRLNTAQDLPGVAVVRSIVDARRVGVIRPLLEDELKQLFPIHFAEIHDLPVSDDLFATGMEWARNPGHDVPPMVVMRRHRSGPSWTISDQLSEDRATWRIPDALWPALITMLDPHECLNLALAAETQGKLLHATKAAAKAATSSEQATLANLLLGRLHQKLGNASAAKSALVAVIDIGPSDEACAAADLLGRMFHNEGDFDHAIEYWTLATQWPGDAHALMSWFELGRLHAMLGNWEEAIDALSRDFSDGPLPDLALRAETLLAFARGSIDDLERVLEAWECVSGEHGGHVAASALREYLLHARHSTEQAHRSPSPDPTDIEMVLAAARRLRDLGKRHEALEEFRRTAASAHSGLRAAALYEAGSTAEDLGLLDEARKAFDASISCAQPGYSGLVS